MLLLAILMYHESQWKAIVIIEYVLEQQPHQGAVTNESCLNLCTVVIRSPLDADQSGKKLLENSECLTLRVTILRHRELLP